MEDTNYRENEYTKAYSEDSLFNKIIKSAQKAGIKVIYAVLLLYYSLQKPATPKWAKAEIIGALGYFIVPIDAIPDIAPGIGYSDDIGVLILAIAAVSMYIDDEVKRKARIKLKDWFGDYNQKFLVDIDNKIDKD